MCRVRRYESAAFLRPPHIAACTEKQIISLLVINLLQIIPIREPERLISYPRGQEIPYFYANRRSVIVFNKSLSIYFVPYY